MKNMIKENVKLQNLQTSIGFTSVGTNTGTVLNLQNSVVDLLKLGCTMVVEVRT